MFYSLFFIMFFSSYFLEKCFLRSCLIISKCIKSKKKVGDNLSNKKEKKKNLLKQVLRPFSKVFATDYMCCSELAGRWLFGNKEYDNGNVYLLNNAIDLDKFKYDEQFRSAICTKYCTY